ncbi:MAG: VCBS repeat-containing protein, partial [Planctomycetota bacterium]
MKGKISAFFLFPGLVWGFLAGHVFSQGLIYEVLGRERSGVLGAAVARIRDLDGDGVDDLLVGVPRAMKNGNVAGKVEFHSGRDGSLIRELFGSRPSQQILGSNLAVVGDTDGDGVEDFLTVSNLTDAQGFPFHRLFLFSGASGAERFELAGDATTDYFANAFDEAGDVNRDGVRDFIVGAQGDFKFGTNSGMARVYSGKDGTILHQFNGSFPGERAGLSVAGAGDFDGDGFADLIAGGNRNVKVYSGRSGEVLLLITGPDLWHHFGGSFDIGPDLDGDGLPEIVFGVSLITFAVDGISSLQVLFARGGRTLYFLPGTLDRDGFGTEVAFLGDLDRDGFPDFAAGAAFQDGEEPFAGRVLVYSGWELLLSPPEPGFAGRANTLRLGHSVRGSRLLVFAGRKTGATAVPGCPALNLEILHPAPAPAREDLLRPCGRSRLVALRSPFRLRPGGPVPGARAGELPQDPPP